MRRVVYSSLATVTLACGSCSQEDNGLYPVWGEVRIDGSSAAGATVFFHRQDANPNEEQMMMGIVQDDGSFELVCGSLGAGAPPGEYDVLIEWKEVLGQSQGRPQRGPDKLNGRFADRRHPRLHATVKAEANELVFELREGE
jgi:hypothetical protein